MEEKWPTQWRPRPTVCINHSRHALCNTKDHNYRNEHTLLIWRYFQGCVNNIGDKIPRYITTYYFWLKYKCCRDHNLDITLPVRYSLDSIKTGIALKLQYFLWDIKIYQFHVTPCVYVHAGFTLGAVVLHIIGFLLGVAAIAIGKKFST